MYVRECKGFQRRKAPVTRNAQLVAMRVSADIVGMLGSQRCYRYVLVIINHFSHSVHLIPLRAIVPSILMDQRLHVAGVVPSRMQLVATLSPGHPGRFFSLPMARMLQHLTHLARTGAKEHVCETLFYLVLSFVFVSFQFDPYFMFFLFV